VYVTGVDVDKRAAPAGVENGRKPPVDQVDRPSETAAVDRARVTSPVGPGSRLVPRPTVSSSMAGGQPELRDTATGHVHRISPAAAELWASLDGRTLLEIRPEVARGDGDAMAVIEVLRRLKALDLVEDAA
jgi:hypothetical protein